MNRDEAKQLLPIIKAFSEGKEIERRSFGEKQWKEANYIVHTDCNEYRIKPSPKYRPFANAEECWQEILKHQPVGWVKSISDETLIQSILLISREGITLVLNSDNFCVMFDTYTFVDGTIFGTKEESEG